MNQDEEHLRLLSIFYYVYAGLIAMGVCLAGLYFIIGIVLLVSPHGLGTRENPAGFAGVPLAIIGGGLGLLGAAFVTCLLIAARSLSQKKRYTFCLVMGGFVCVLFPIGTALGVFSLIVLIRPSVKALFDQATPPVFAR